MVPFSMTLVDL